MLEYYYNGLGKDSYKKYSVTDLINMMGGDMAGFGQQYVMTGIRKDLFDSFFFSGFALINATDGSTMILPAIDYNFTDDLSLNLTGQVALGNKEKSEYGSVYSTVLFKVMGYF